VAAASRTPLSTGAIYFFGMEPPTTLLTKTTPRRRQGFNIRTTCPVLAPAAALADKFPLRLGLFGDGLPIGHLGLAHPASTLNSRIRRSTMISRWSSPSADDGLAGIRVAVDRGTTGLPPRLRQRMPQFVLVRLVAGSMAISMTAGDCAGFPALPGPLIRQGIAGGGVLESTAATMSPALSLLISSRLLACILRSRPTRSLTPLVAFSTLDRKSSPRNRPGERSDAR